MEVIILYAKQCEMQGAGYDLLTLYPEPRFEYHCGLSNGQHFLLPDAPANRRRAPAPSFARTGFDHA